MAIVLLFLVHISHLIEESSIRESLKKLRQLVYLLTQKVSSRLKMIMMSGRTMEPESAQSQKK